MLTPSYSEVMDVLNRDCDKEHRAVTSRYSIVIAAAKRARQIVAGSPFDATGIRTDKAVSIAIGEISRGLVQVYPDGCDEPEPVYREENYDNESAYKSYYGENVGAEAVDTGATTQETIIADAYIAAEPSNEAIDSDPEAQGDDAPEQWDVSEDIV